MKKKIMISLLFSVLTGSVIYGQVKYVPAGAYPFSISVGGGITDLYGDLKSPVIAPAAKANFDYNITPFFSIGIEGQYGQLSEKGTEYEEHTYTSYVSQSTYYSSNINARIAVGQFLDDPNTFMRIVGGFYLGTGIGIISGKVDKITSTDLASVNYKDNEMDVPVNLGINVDLPVSWLSLNLNYQYNFTNSDKLDGYSFYGNGNTGSDGYSLTSLSIRYYFGRIRQ